MTSGIYFIEQWNTGRFYVGHSTNIYLRFREHVCRLNKNAHKNPRLQNAWNKYGSGEFIFGIAEECPVSQLVEREQYWIDWLDACRLGFNCALYAGRSPMLGRKLTPENNKKLHAHNIGNTYTLGFRHSPSTKLKLSLINKGRSMPASQGIKISNFMKQWWKEHRTNEC